MGVEAIRHDGDYSIYKRKDDVFGRDNYLYALGRAVDAEFDNDLFASYKYGNALKKYLDNPEAACGMRGRSALFSEYLDARDGQWDGNIKKATIDELKSKLGENSNYDFAEDKKKCIVDPTFWAVYEKPTAATPKPSPTNPSPANPNYAKQPNPYKSVGCESGTTDPYAKSSEAQRKTWADVQKTACNGSMNQYVLDSTASGTVQTLTVKSGMTLSLIAKAILDKNGYRPGVSGYNTKLKGLTDELVSANGCSTLIRTHPVN